jgi:hypothetical protein
MFLVSLYLSFQLDHDMAQSERERVLRSIRDKVKNKHGSKITTRTDEDISIAFAFFDSNANRAEQRANELLEEIEGFSQARIDTHLIQVFEWFEGSFEELPLSGKSASNHEVRGAHHTKSVFSTKGSSKSDLIYYSEDDDSKNPVFESKNRRSLPTRKYPRS